MRTKIIVVFLTGLLGSSPLWAQGSTLDEVHLFHSFFRDATFTENFYGELGATNSDFTRYFDVLNFGVRGGYGINPNLEVGAQVGLISLDPKVGDQRSGLSDLLLTAKHRIFSGTTKFAFGGLVAVPIGDDDIRQGRLNYGAFVAARHPFNSGLVAAANLAAIYGRDMILDHGEVRLVLGGAVIYPVSSQLSVVGAFDYENEIDYQIATGGVDFKLGNGTHLRGFFATNFGVGNGAPDVSFGVSFLHAFAGTGYRFGSQAR